MAEILPFPSAAEVFDLNGRDRRAIERIVEGLITFLDHVDGDPDDECDLIEDDFFDAHPYMDAGCPIADPGGCEHDGREQEEGL